MVGRKFYAYGVPIGFAKSVRGKLTFASPSYLAHTIGSSQHHKEEDSKVVVDYRYNVRPIKNVITTSGVDYNDMVRSLQYEAPWPGTQTTKSLDWPNKPCKFNRHTADLYSIVQAMQEIDNHVFQSGVSSHGPHCAVVGTSNRHLYNGIGSYIDQWRHQSWHMSNGEILPNVPLWKLLYSFLQKPYLYWFLVRTDRDHNLALKST